MYEINNKVHENTINFLYQAATNILPKENSSLKLLKSFYINKTRDIARRENLSIPNKIYGPMAMCQKCSVPWGEGTSKISVDSTKPKNQKKNNFIMVQKKKCNKKIIKKYVVLNCTTCKSRTKHILPKQVIAETKPLPQPARNNTHQLLKVNNPPQTKVSRKKKSKNKSPKTVSNKTIQKSKKPNQNHILQLAKLLSSSTSRPTAVSHDDKLKHFLK